jgi:BirA family biotin operon repressor/biotin-[acetyl-CoA-carboxylase] ligase
LTSPRFAIEHYPSLASTNDLVRERALGGEPEGLVVRAGIQTRGRGRHGRSWASPTGNLYCSMLLRPERPLAEAATLSLVIGLSLADTLAEEAPGPELKWPNDVMVGGAKLAGILLESVIVGAKAPVIVAGIGVNVATCPKDLPYPATSLAGLGVDLPPESLLERFLEAFGRDYDCWRAGGFSALRERWLERAHGRGREARVRDGDRLIDGRFVDVDPEGRLVIDTRTGRRLIHAGELFFPLAEATS